MNKSLELEPHKMKRTRERFQPSASVTTATATLTGSGDKVAPEPAEKPDRPIRARKKTEDKINSTIDGRSLRATGRTTQWNVRIRPDQKKEVQRRAKQHKLEGGAGEYLEQALEFYMKAEDEGRAQ